MYLYMYYTVDNNMKSKVSKERVGEKSPALERNFRLSEIKERVPSRCLPFYYRSI